jgi:hypothetical protein
VADGVKRFVRRLRRWALVLVEALDLHEKRQHCSSFPTLFELSGCNVCFHCICPLKATLYALLER